MEIREVLREELIIKEMAAELKEPAINELAVLLLEHGYVTDLDKYIAAVMKREEEFTTGIGMGVAIPHGKSEAVAKPAVCFGRSHGGIDYGSDDGNPVHLIFLIAVPVNSNDEHLRILAHISRKLMHEEIRTKLLNAASVEEIYQTLA